MKSEPMKNEAKTPDLKNTFVPLYRQIKAYILELITTGALAPGAQIPTEPALMEQFDVSRVTVRAAINELVEEGMLIKRQGKGTFVIGSTFDEDRISHAKGFYESCRINGAEGYSKKLDQAIVPMPLNICRVLMTTPGEKAIYFRFLRYADGLEVMIDESWYLMRYDYLMDCNEDAEFYHIIQQREDTTIITGSSSMEICQATDEEAKLLNTAPGAPLLLRRACILNKSFQPVHYTKQRMLGERYTFNM